MTMTTAHEQQPMRIFSAQLALEGQAGDDSIHVRGRYVHGAEAATWASMREIQRTYSPILASPGSVLRGIVTELLNPLRYMSMQAEIDELYRMQFGEDYEVDLDLTGRVAGDRVKALAKLDGIEQILMMEMHNADRLQKFAGDVIAVIDEG